MTRGIGLVIRVVLVVLFLAVLVLAGRTLILKKKKALSQAPRYRTPPTLVDTSAAYLGDLTESHDFLAMVKPVQSANITARVTTTVETVAVDEGDTVVPGQPLVTLDHRQIDSQIEAVQAQIRQVQAELQGNESTVASLSESFSYWSREAERDLELASKETIPRAQAETTLEKKNDAEGNLAAARQRSVAIQEQIQSIEARLGELKTTLSYCQIESPFGGVVTSRLVDPGDQAAPGKTLLVIESAGAMMIAFDIPQTDLSVVRTELAVSFQVDGETRDATITRLYPSLNRARMVRAEVVLDGSQAEGLTSGQYLTATVDVKQHEDVCLIPVSALVEDGPGGNAHVFVVKEGVLEARQVYVLGTACEQAAVESLEPGEQVVLSSFLGWARLADGMKVEVHP